MKWDARDENETYWESRWNENRLWETTRDERDCKRMYTYVYVHVYSQMYVHRGKKNFPDLSKFS